MPTFREERGERRRTRVTCRNQTSWGIGVSLVALGTLLFLDNLGIVSAGRIMAGFWPGLLLAFGVWKLLKRYRRSDIVVGAICAGFGALMLLGSWGILHFRTHDGSWALAILLIASGTIAMQKALDRADPDDRIRPGLRTTPPGSWRQREGNVPAAPAAESTASASAAPLNGLLPIYLDDWVLGGAKKRRVECGDFRGGEVSSILGEMIIDLRQAHQPLPELPMELRAQAIFGVVRLRVPQDWVVQMDGSAVFGAFNDKTIPMQNLNGRQPVLIVTGGAFFGEVSVDT